MADRWELLGNSEVLAVHGALLPSGKVLYFSGSQHDETPTSVDATRLWNPENGRVEYVPSPRTLINEPVDLFCCGHSLLASGELLVAGGTEKYDKAAPVPHGNVHHFTGIQSAYVFDWRDEQWHYTGGMSEGRWYPTLITLHDGRVLAMSGHGGASGPHENTGLEIFNYINGQWNAAFDFRPPDQDRFATAPPLEETGGDFWILRVHVIPMVYYPRLHQLPNRQIFSLTALRTNSQRKTTTVDLATGIATAIADPPLAAMWGV